MKKKKLSKSRYLNWFPNSFITGANTLKLHEDDGNVYYDNPVCMKFDCRSMDMSYEGQNETYEVDVYTCNDCGAISVQGYETVRTGGNIGSEEDLNWLSLYHPRYN